MHRTLLALLVIVPSVLAAQGERERGFRFRAPVVSLTLSGGLGLPNSSGDLWAFTFDELTMSRRDLTAFDQGIDLGIRLTERMDLVLGYGMAASRTQSELRDWVDENDQPITQRTRFTRRPLGATLRYALKPRGSMIGKYAWVPATFVPYVGVGGGRMSYRFEQNGEFVDDVTLEIFRDDYRASGTVGFASASTGFVWSMVPSLAVTGEVRYLHASADGRPSFVGFDKLDLSGVSTMVGFTLRLY